MEKTFCICHLCLLLLFTCCTGQRERMEQIIHDAKEQNLNYVPFTTDSLLREAVAYYDRHGTANERLLAHYLLGCAYRDMNEAPLAIITWEDAVACADTTATDCDYATLFRVYGQMAEMYRRQHLPEKDLDASKHFCHFAKRANDTYNYIRGIELQGESYYALEDSFGIFQTAEKARQLYMKNGMEREAAQVYAAAIHFLVNHEHFEQAHRLMEVYEKESGLFNEQGEIIRTREQYYYYKGMYFLGVCLLDSAEIQFRKLLPIKDNVHDAYRGLLSLYQQKHDLDSTLKYAHLFEEAIIEHLKNTKVEAVTQAKSMYDYQRNEKIAKEERQKAKRVKFTLAVVIVIGSCASLSIYILYNRKRKREQRKLLELNNDLYQSKNDLAKAYDELSYLRQNLPEKEQTEALIKEKEKRIQALETEIEEFQSQLGYMSQKRDEEELMNTAIVMQLKDISHPRTVKDAQGRIQVIQPRACTDDEWKDMVSVVQQYHHNLYAYIADRHQLPKQQFKVCILSRLRFETQEMSTLLNTSPQTISNTRNKIAKRLFDLNDLTLLNDRLAAL